MNKSNIVIHSLLCRFIPKEDNIAGPYPRALAEKVRSLIDQGLTKDKQLNNSERTESLSNQTTTFVSLMKSTNVLSRARYTEDALEKIVRQGVKQYVILGAGLEYLDLRVRIF